MSRGNRVRWALGCFVAMGLQLAVPQARAAEARPETEQVKEGDNGTFQWEDLADGEAYDMLLDVDNIDPKDFKVPSAAAQSDGGAKWSVTKENAREADFKGPVAKATAKENGKPYRPRFRGEFVVKADEGNEGGNANTPIWKLKGEYDVGDERKLVVDWAGEHKGDRICLIDSSPSIPDGGMYPVPLKGYEEGNWPDEVDIVSNVFDATNPSWLERAPKHYDCAIEVPNPGSQKSRTFGESYTFAAGYEEDNVAIEFKKQVQDANVRGYEQELMIELYVGFFPYSDANRERTYSKAQSFSHTINVSTTETVSKSAGFSDTAGVTVGGSYGVFNAEATYEYQQSVTNAVAKASGYAVSGTHSEEDTISKTFQLEGGHAYQVFYHVWQLFTLVEIEYYEDEDTDGFPDSNVLSTDTIKIGMVDSPRLVHKKLPAKVKVP